MRLSGVDPSIIRELSGIYKPFVNAFKELISNAYDADAKCVLVALSPDFSCLEVTDDGSGMTPYQFHRDFTRMGGSTARLTGGRSPGGRARVGFKGIGFLSVARYCRSLDVESCSNTHFDCVREVAHRRRTTQSYVDLIDGPADLNGIRAPIEVKRVVAVVQGKNITLKPGGDYVLARGQVKFKSDRAKKATLYRYHLGIDCSDLVLRATINFDYLLSLENQADLIALDNFCEFSLRPKTDDDPGSFTRIRLIGLKDFVARDLSAPAAKGKAKNIVFKSGKDRFLWNLARSSPIRDEIPAEIDSDFLHKWRRGQDKEDFPELKICWGDEPAKELRRPIFIPGQERQSVDETLVPVHINESGLRVEGYILARSEVIYPAELRGITIRVRNVAIGDAGFFGWESILSGPRKAALSQITGELRVLEGLEASDAINPGRESFYEENEHYRILKHVMTGSGETIGGIIGSAVNNILSRIHVRSQVRDALDGARCRRRTLGDVAGAVGFYTGQSTPEARNLSAFFRSEATHCELADAKSLSLRPGHKLGGFEVTSASGLESGFEIDYENRVVRLDFTHDLWSSSVFLDGHFYEVRFKVGRPSQPLCEFDNEKKLIYVNWGHAVKQNMNEENFLKSAILLRLAYHAAPQDANRMMSLALSMMSYRAE